MAETGLTLYLAVHKGDRAACDLQQCVPRRLAGGLSYVGLREQAVYALQGAQLHTHEPVGKDNHLVLQVHFTAHGIAHFATTCADVEYGFAPVLTKKIFKGNTTDWQVWHFLGDLPLEVTGPDGRSYLKTTWQCVE